MFKEKDSFPSEEVYTGIKEIRSLSTSYCPFTSGRGSATNTELPVLILLHTQTISYGQVPFGPPSNMSGTPMGPSKGSSKVHQRDRESDEIVHRFHNRPFTPRLSLLQTLK